MISISDLSKKNVTKDWLSENIKKYSTKSKSIQMDSFKNKRDCVVIKIKSTASTQIVSKRLNLQNLLKDRYMKNSESRKDF